MRILYISIKENVIQLFIWDSFWLKFLVWGSQTKKSKKQKDEKKQGTKILSCSENTMALKLKGLI